MDKELEGGIARHRGTETAKEERWEANERGTTT